MEQDNTTNDVINGRLLADAEVHQASQTTHLSLINATLKHPSFLIALDSLVQKMEFYFKKV